MTRRPALPTPLPPSSRRLDRGRWEVNVASPHPSRCRTAYGFPAPALTDFRPGAQLPLFPEVRSA